MELAFSSTALRELCEDEGMMVTQLGNENARALKTILADFRALPNASDLQSLHTVFLSTQGQLCLSLANGVTVIAKANHLDNPRDSNGHVDWSEVSRLKIDFVGDNQ